MELSKIDVEKLVKKGYKREEFTIVCEDGLTRLRNVAKRCYFYDSAKKRCRIYQYRPQGCRLYPVVYSVEQGAAIDTLCPMRKTISRKEFRDKSRFLTELVKRIERETGTEIISKKKES
jgi:uncharacterized protein